jgi:hypothetical protein
VQAIAGVGTQDSAAGALNEIRTDQHLVVITPGAVKGVEELIAFNADFIGAPQGTHIHFEPTPRKGLTCFILAVLLAFRSLKWLF